MKIPQILLKLRLHGLPHSRLQRRPHKTVEIVISPEYADKVKVGQQSLRMPLCHITQQGSEGLTLPQAFPNVSCIKDYLRGKQRALLICLGKHGLHSGILRLPQGSRRGKKIQTSAPRGIQSHGPVLRPCKTSLSSQPIRKTHDQTSARPFGHSLLRTPAAGFPPFSSLSAFHKHDPFYPVAALNRPTSSGP